MISADLLVPVLGLDVELVLINVKVLGVLGKVYKNEVRIASDPHRL